MNKDYDVVIIGAGPAGSCCARHLVDAGFTVLVLEKSHFKRYKACAGLLSEKSLNVINHTFGEIPDFMKCDPYTVNVKASRLGNGFMDIMQPMVSVRRHEFDEWLIKESGADIREKTIYLNHTVETDLIRLDIISNQKNESISCKFLIGADGGWSTVRKNIDKNFNKSDFLISQQKVYDATGDLTPENYYFILSKKYSDLLSWFTMKDNLLYIGTSYKPKTGKYYFNKIFDKVVNDFNMKIKNKIRQESCLMDNRFTMDRFFFGEGNVFLIGEASGLLNAYGEGIAAALWSAKYMAEALIESKASNQNVLELYEIKVKKEVNYAIKELQI